MVTIILSIFTVSLIYVIWDAINYTNEIKQNDRYNRESLEESFKKKKEFKSNTKVSKAKVQNKRKPGRPKKQIKK
tara:strand:- start:535 stop:759 length:225 start_codon:yes stop_codon:yes gene_type:complete